MLMPGDRSGQGEAHQLPTDVRHMAEVDPIYWNNLASRRIMAGDRDRRLLWPTPSHR
jgi:hypothetical protein